MVQSSIKKAHEKGWAAEMNERQQRRSKQIAVYRLRMTKAIAEGDKVEESNNRYLLEQMGEKP